MTDTLVTETTSDDRPKAHLRPRGTSFLGLVGVELRRLWWRRLTKAVIVAIIGVVGIALFTAYRESRPEVISQQLDQFNEMRAQAERDMPQMLKDCRDMQAQERERSGDPTIDMGCRPENFQPPTLEQFGLTLPFADVITETLASFLYYLFAFLAFLLAASAVSAEFATGSMGNWLTFQPRRLRVAASKLVASCLGGAALAAFGLLLTHLGARMIATFNRPGADLTLPEAADVAGTLPQLLLRVVAVAALAAVAGAALGLLLRHSAAVLGLLVGYGVVIEGIVASSLGEGRLKPWVASTNLEAFLNLGTKYWANTCKDSPDGGVICESKELLLSYTHSWLYLLIATLALVVVGLVAFRRRDVT